MAIDLLGIAFAYIQAKEMILGGEMKLLIKNGLMLTMMLVLASYSHGSWSMEVTGEPSMPEMFSKKTFSKTDFKDEFMGIDKIFLFYTSFEDGVAQVEFTFNPNNLCKAFGFTKATHVEVSLEEVDQKNIALVAGRNDARKNGIVFDENGLFNYYETQKSRQVHSEDMISALKEITCLKANNEEAEKIVALMPEVFPTVKTRELSRDLASEEKSDRYKLFLSHGK